MIVVTINEANNSIKNVKLLASFKFILLSTEHRNQTRILMFGAVFYKFSFTSFQSINPLPVSSSSTARAMTLRLSALNGSV